MTTLEIRRLVPRQKAVEAVKLTRHNVQDAALWLGNPHGVVVWHQEGLLGGEGQVGLSIPRVGRASAGQWLVKTPRGINILSDAQLKQAYQPERKTR